MNFRKYFKHFRKQYTLKKCLITVSSREKFNLINNALWYTLIFNYLTSKNLLRDEEVNPDFPFFCVTLKSKSKLFLIY